MGNTAHRPLTTRESVRYNCRFSLLSKLPLVLTLGGNLLAQEPGDPDYEPNPDTVDEYERLGEEEGSDYELDGDAFDEAADQAGLDAPQVVPPTGSEIDDFRARLEAHWGGNLPALWAYLDSIDPAGGGQPRAPRRRGGALLGAGRRLRRTRQCDRDGRGRARSVARSGGAEAAAALPELLAPPPGWTPAAGRDTLAA